MYNFWCLINLFTIKYQESRKILKTNFKAILDLCYVKFLELFDEIRPCDTFRMWFKKMIKLDNFSKIAIFKFGSNFQVKIHKKSNKIKKKFRCRSACRCRSRLGLVKIFLDAKKKVIRVKNLKIQFFEYYLIFEYKCA